jgi:hypothetical protein
MADTAIAAVLSKFGELAANEARLLIQVDNDMMLLRDRLEWLQAFIRDADRKRRAGTDGLTRVWVRQTRDVAFQAEDAVDEFLYEVGASLPIISTTYDTCEAVIWWRRSFLSVKSIQTFFIFICTTVATNTKSLV